MAASAASFSISYTRFSHTLQYIASWKQRGGCETVMGINTCLSTSHPGNKQGCETVMGINTCLIHMLLAHLTVCFSHTLQYIASWKQRQGCETVTGINTCLIHMLLAYLTVCFSHTLQYIASWKQRQGCETVMGIICLVDIFQHTL